MNYLKNWWCTHVLPLVYDDSLSYYEVLCKLKYKINEIVEKINDLYTNFKEYVLNVLKEPEAEGIIKGYIAEQQNKTLFDGEMSLTKIFTDKNVYSEDNLYTGLQGGWYDKANNIYVYALRNHYASPEVNCKIVVQDLNTGQVLRSQIIPVPHGNSLCVDVENDKLYLCGRYYKTSESEKSVWVLKYSTLETLESWDINYSDTYIQGLYWYNNTLWGYVYDAKTVGSIDVQTHNFTPIIALETTNYFNNFAIDDSYVYMLGVNQAILEIFTYTGVKIKTWGMGRTNGTGYFGELQNLTVYNQDIYFGSMWYESVNRPETYYMDIYTFNYIEGNQNWDFYSTLYTPQGIVDVYCDVTYQGHDSNGSEDKPFKTAMEAIASGTIYSKTGNVHVHFKTPGNYGRITCSNIYLRMSNESGGAVTLGESYLYGVNGLFESITFNGANTEQTAIVTAINCQINLLTNTINNNGGYTYGLYARNSIIGVFSLTYSGSEYWCNAVGCSRINYTQTPYKILLDGTSESITTYFEEQEGIPNSPYSKPHAGYCYNGPGVYYGEITTNITDITNYQIYDVVILFNGKRFSDTITLTTPAGGCVNVFDNINGTFKYATITIAEQSGKLVITNNSLYDGTNVTSKTDNTADNNYAQIYSVFCYNAK